MPSVTTDAESLEAAKATAKLNDLLRMLLAGRSSVRQRLKVVSTLPREKFRHLHGLCHVDITADIEMGDALPSVTC